jgi:exodeoxyribonuclease V alpha subunit
MMQKKNFYSDDLEIMNGEEGYITKITDDYMEITFSKDKVVSYRYESSTFDSRGSELDDKSLDQLTLDSITHSFSKSIHKSQGSEYEYVIIYLPPENYRFVTLNMLYTAITRAKKKVWIVSDKSTLDVITTQKLPKRYEILGEKLVDILNPPSSTDEESSPSSGEDSSPEDD